MLKSFPGYELINKMCKTLEIYIFSTHKRENANKHFHVSSQSQAITQQMEALNSGGACTESQLFHIHTLQHLFPFLLKSKVYNYYILRINIMILLSRLFFLKWILLLHLFLFALPSKCTMYYLRNYISAAILLRLKKKKLPKILNPLYNPSFSVLS